MKLEYCNKFKPPLYTIEMTEKEAFALAHTLLSQIETKNCNIGGYFNLETISKSINFFVLTEKEYNEQEME